MSERISCCVPFCRRTRKNPDGFVEWICGDHWRAVPKSYRRAYGRRRRAWRRFKAQSDGMATARLWDRVKAVAIERAAGL